MRRFSLLICVLFSLLVTPVIQAAGADCRDGECPIEQTQKNNKQSKYDHLCCCHHTVAERKILPEISTYIQLKKVSYLLDKTFVHSLNIGPLLQPPSYA